TPKAISTDNFTPVDVERTALSITNFTPKTGPPGTVVTVTGTGFRSATYIHLGSAGSVSAYEVNSAGTALKFRVPTYWSGRLADPIIIGSAISTDNFTPVERTALSITGFTPKTGLPGTVVTVTGTGFDIRPAANSIHLGSAGSVSAYEVNSSGTELKFRVPGSWSEYFEYPIRIGSASSNDNFTPVQTALSITNFDPKTGPPGTEVTITGTGFSLHPSHNYIRLGDRGDHRRPHWVNGDGTELKFRVPEAWYHASAGLLTVNFSSFSSGAPKATSTDNFTPIAAQGPSNPTGTDTDLEALDLRYAQKTGVYTKTESDAKYPLQTVVYTKSESDAKYALQTALPDLSVYALEVESDTRYAQKTDLEALDIESIQEALINLSNQLAALNRQVGETTGELVQSVRLEQNISVRPNPASDYLEIETPEDTDVKIIDPTAKVLRTEQIARGLHRISIQELPAGSYLLLLQIGTQATSYTFIKG
ncbi:MAG: IPT/TIG domain-containing protein, partial [Cytophagales bacterium]|nr:IPT/TIG domain-containing protein [Cytophagales bacterium]